MNHKPKAADVQSHVFDVTQENYDYLLDYAWDSDRDTMFLRFFNGVRIDAKHGLERETEVQGVYGTFYVQPDGFYRYVVDTSNAAVQAMQEGDLLRETVQYKISDGHGGTDVGALYINVQKPDTGVLLATFDDLRPGEFDMGYRGFVWGAAYNDGDPAGLYVVDGNTMLRGGTYTTPVYRADDKDFLLTGLDVVSMGGDAQVVRFLSWWNEEKTITIQGTTPVHVDFSDWTNPMSSFTVVSDLVEYTPDSNHPYLLFDNVGFIV